MNQREMEEAINTFVQQIQYGDVALFYFSGHGVQVSGENYLLPISEVMKSESDIRYRPSMLGIFLGRWKNRTIAPIFLSWMPVEITPLKASAP